MTVPGAQAIHFENLINFFKRLDDIRWRAECVAAAWERKSKGFPVHITGEHVWWQLVVLPGELQAAIADAKREAGIGAGEVADAVDAPAVD